MRIAIVGVLLLALGGATGWAIARVFVPPADVLDATDHTLVEVSPGVVGSEINLNAVAEWVPTPIGSSAASGVVTSINITPGQEVGAGAILFTTGLRPTVIAQGIVPSFRPITYGSEGPDVAQLQTMLTSLGFFDGAIDGRFGSRTGYAVDDWQESLGLKSTGAVEAGDVVFVPTLPMRILLDPKLVRVGLSLNGGDEIVMSLGPAPTFSVSITPAQSGLLPQGTRVEITGPSGEKWEGYVKEQKTKDDSTVAVSLEGKDGVPICGPDCASLSVTDQTLLPCHVVTVESTRGLVVPSAALLSKADGSLVVLDAEGNEQKVTVVASARGMSVIEGVPSGSYVQVPAKEH